MFWTVPHSVPASSGIELGGRMLRARSQERKGCFSTCREACAPWSCGRRPSFLPRSSRWRCQAGRAGDPRSIFGVCPGNPGNRWFRRIRWNRWRHLGPAVPLPNSGPSYPGPPGARLQPNRLQLVLALGELLLVEPGLAGHAETRVRGRAEGQEGAATRLSIWSTKLEFEYFLRILNCWCVVVFPTQRSHLTWSVSKHSRIFCSAPSDSASRRECTF